MFWNKNKDRRGETELIYGPPEIGNYIICNGEKHFIKWNKIVRFDQSHNLALALPDTHFKQVKGKRNVPFFVTHWDACLSTHSCFNILLKRKLSVHFAIDNDGTIYQFMDANDIAWHAGNRKWNAQSIGVEISNAYYTKYQQWYAYNGHGERPIWINDVTHAKEYGEEFLGFYDIQIQALTALVASLHEFYEIPLQTPTTEYGNRLVTTVHPPAAKGRYAGFVNHYHLTPRKMDCAGLNLYNVMLDARKL